MPLHSVSSCYIFIYQAVQCFHIFLRPFNNYIIFFPQLLLSFRSSSINPFSPISPLIPSAQVPRFLLPGGRHFITSIGSLPSSILWNNIFSKSVISHFVSSCCSEEHVSLYYDVCCTLLTSHEHKWTPGLHYSDDGVFNHITMHISRLTKMYSAVFLLPKCDNASKQIYRYCLLLLDFVHRVTDI